MRAKNAIPKSGIAAVLCSIFPPYFAIFQKAVAMRGIIRYNF